MTERRKSNPEMLEENIRLRAQVARLEDRLDHLAEHGPSAKALQHVEALHAAVMMVMSDVVVFTDEVGRITYVSPNAHLIFGCTPNEIMKQGRIGWLLPDRLFDPDTLEQRGEVANIECQSRDAIGRARELLVTVRRIEIQGSSVLYVCRDVTERKNIELEHELLSMTLERQVEERTQQLRDSRERYRRYVEGLRGEYLFYATNPEGVITYLSPSAHSIMGYTPDQVVGRNWREFVDTNDPRTPLLEEYERMRLLGLHTPSGLIAPTRHANGKTVFLEFTDTQLHDADGRIVSIEGICRDVTQRLADDEALRRARDELELRVQQRTAELTATNERLRESEHRYRTVVEDQLEFIVRWHGEGIRTFVNESYCRSWRESRDDLVGTSFFPDIFEPELEQFKKQLAAVSVERPAFTEEHRVTLPDGQTAWRHWTHRALFNNEGSLIEFQSVGYDVTERRKREEHAREQREARIQLQDLSDRERDVMRYVVAGDANKVIARKLDLSVKTIEKHRSSLMRKLRVRSVPELVRLALLAEALGNA
jgi:PAS domain S-box-containing protein